MKLKSFYSVYSLFYECHIVWMHGTKHMSIIPDVVGIKANTIRATFKSQNIGQRNADSIFSKKTKS
jgi:hypothetical protein